MGSTYICIKQARTMVINGVVDKVKEYCELFTLLTLISGEKDIYVCSISKI